MCTRRYTDACKHTHTWIHMHRMNTHIRRYTHGIKMRQISSIAIQTVHSFTTWKLKANDVICTPSRSIQVYQGCAQVLKSGGYIKVL